MCDDRHDSWPILTFNAKYFNFSTVPDINMFYDFIPSASFILLYRVIKSINFTVSFVNMRLNFECLANV